MFVLEEVFWGVFMFKETFEFKSVFVLEGMLSCF